MPEHKCNRNFKFNTYLLFSILFGMMIFLLLFSSDNIQIFDAEFRWLFEFVVQSITFKIDSFLKLSETKNVKPWNTWKGEEWNEGQIPLPLSLPPSFDHPLIINFVIVRHAIIQISLKLCNPTPTSPPPPQKKKKIQQKKRKVKKKKITKWLCLFISLVTTLSRISMLI